MRPPRLAALLATCFGIGRLPAAPGTWAALAALPAGWLVAAAGGTPALLGAIVVLAAVGIWAADRHAREVGVADPSSVVIDEVVGQWIALLTVPPHPAAYAAAFLLFRAFDIGKPWPVSWIDRRVAGGAGIMLDDMAAGFYAWLVLQIGQAAWRAAFGG